MEKTVTNVLEREINGVEGMDYITSSSTNTGQSNISVVFQSGQEKDIAQVNVQEQSGGGRTSAAPRGESAGDYG